MSAYENFIQDFPRRCQEILEDNWISASVNDLEVTLMLATAIAGFVIPFERLRSSANDHFARGKVLSCSKVIWKLEAKRFKDWIPSGTWEVISAVKSETVKEDVDSWGGKKNREPLPEDALVGQVLSILRNALAHGNIITSPGRFSRSKPAQIEKILLLSKIRDKNTKRLINEYNVIVVGPHDLSLLLNSWFEELRKLNIPPETYQATDITEHDFMDVYMSRHRDGEIHK